LKEARKEKIVCPLRSKDRKYIQLILRNYASKKRGDEIFKILREKKNPTRILYSMKISSKSKIK
jgi:hypothetical protein